MIITYSGKVFDYNNIEVESIEIEDIFHSLVRLNRFIGHSKRTYSVAEHSLYCYLMACKLNYSTKNKLQVLMHDFAEAYMGDCPSPLKKLLPQFIIIEEEVEQAIYKKFELPKPTDEEYALIKRIDRTMLVIEMRDLTLHKYSSLLDENIEISMLDDKDFFIDKENNSEKELIQILKTIFNHLMEQYKKETKTNEI